MIAYLAPGRGRGHAVRAAAICRRLETDVKVYTYLGIDSALELAKVSHESFEDRGEMIAAAKEARPSLVVLDCNAPHLTGPWACRTVCVHRLGRSAMGLGLVIDAECPMPWALPDEMLGRDDARDLLGATDGPLAVTVPTWLSGRCPVAPIGHHSVIAPDLPASIWIQGADLVIGVPGCNLYHEVTGAGVEARWWLPGGHMTDQALRIAQPTSQGPRRALTTEYVEAAARLIDSMAG